MMFWGLAALLTIGALLIIFRPALAKAGAPRSPAERRILLALLPLVPILAVGGYVFDGRPDLPGRPYAAREAERVAAGLPSDRERALVRELAVQMESHPENAEGGAMLGEAYVRDGRFEEAAASFRNALTVRPNSAELLSALGEALTLAAQGEISSDAEAAFRDALKAEPTQQKARFFLALAKAQHGEPEAAKAELRALLNEAAPDVPWRRAVEAALARIDQEPRPQPPQSK